MKILPLFLFLIVSVKSLNAQNWGPTNLTQFNFLSIPSTEVHQSKALSIVFNGISADIYEFDNTGPSWNQKSISGVSEIPQALKSAGSKLYLSSFGLGFGMIYSSVDNGNSFTLDTVGLPKFFTGISTPVGLQYFPNGKIIANLGSAGYWLKDTSATTWEHIDAATLFNGGGDPICYSNGSIFAFDNSGVNILYQSTDDGSTWNTVTNNLPAPFKGDLLVANSQSSRIYVAGGKTDGSEYGIYYSDDSGQNWTKADLDNFIGTDVNGGQQEVKSIWAKGPNIFIGLENDTNQSSLDVLSSNSGISNSTYDTAGLFHDPAGTLYGSAFLEYESHIMMPMSARDVYWKPFSVTGTEKLETEELIRIYPNPVQNELHILGDVKDFSKYSILSPDGSIISGDVISGESISVHGIPSGVYFLKVESRQYSQIVRFVKN